MKLRSTLAVGAIAGLLLVGIPGAAQADDVDGNIKESGTGSRIRR